jgi:hypothetical protein
MTPSRSRVIELGRASLATAAAYPSKDRFDGLRTPQPPCAFLQYRRYGTGKPELYCGEG